VGNSASLEPGVVTACPAVNWEGHGGYDIASIQSFEDADGTVRSNKPDIILLLVGTNDVGQGETGNITSQLTKILNDLFYQDPNAWIIVSTIPPINPSAPNALPAEAGWASQVPFANAQIRATAAQYPRTSLIDFYAATVNNVNANIGSDGVHPSVIGYGILASLWEGAIKNYIDNGN
jgi:lysophospholipase L1-like esterase